MARSMIRRKSSAAFFLPSSVCDDVQIADDADGRLPGPGQEALGVLLDEADRAVGHVDVVLEEVLAALRP